MTRNFAFFDFDGTLTTSDTFPLFAFFSRGRLRALWAAFVTLPWLILMKLRLYPNGKVKERLFSRLYKGMPVSVFEDFGRRFAERIDRVVNPGMMEALSVHQKNNDTVYVVTASIDQWVRPWCEANGVANVIATLPEVGADGCLTGRFATPNCYGPEKVRRILLMEPDIDSAVKVYGDSRGDREMLNLMRFSRQKGDN